MVYNRCVGTKYCSNNCPYKVRRFNFFRYTDADTPILKLGVNPNVSVASRGVMEKCTYCVQRINNVRFEAEKQNRPIHDGEILTACQQVCPTEAIVFGNINDPESKVARLKREPHNYGLLAELNTQPRTSYLAKVKNPNPTWRRSGAHAQGSPAAVAPAQHSGGRAGVHAGVGHRQNQRGRPFQDAEVVAPRFASGSRFSISISFHRLAVPQGHRHLGHQHPHRLGLGHRQLRLVGRHRHAGTLISAVLLLFRRNGARPSIASPRR